MSSSFQTERDLQRSCFKFYRESYPSKMMRFIMIKNTSVGYKQGIFNKLDGVVAGVSDSIFLSDGKVAFLEFKTKIGIQSQAQKDFENECKRLNLDYLIIRSLEAFKEFLNKKPTYNKSVFFMYKNHQFFLLLYFGSHLKFYLQN